LNNEEKEKVFNRFYRADKSRQHKGTGLGLSLALAIIKLHGGQITLADNNPGLKVITKF
jgi:signal transduction histidine kinase